MGTSMERIPIRRRGDMRVVASQAALHDRRAALAEDLAACVARSGGRGALIDSTVIEPGMAIIRAGAEVGPAGPSRPCATRGAGHARTGD